MLRGALRTISTLSPRSVTAVVSANPPRVVLEYEGAQFEYFLSLGKTLDNLSTELKSNHNNLRVVKFLDGTKEYPLSTFVTKAFMHGIDVLLNNEVVRVYPNMNYVYSGDMEVMQKCCDCGVPVNDSRTIARFAQRLKTILPNTFSDMELKAAIEESFKDTEATVDDEEKLLKDELEKLTSELEPLKSQKEALETAAQIYADRVIKIGLGTVCAQFGVIAYGTFGLYGWDVMEPVSYMCGLTWTWLGYFYFLARKQDFDFSDFHSHIARNKFLKLQRQYKLDVTRIDLLEQTIQDITRQLYNLT